MRHASYCVLSLLCAAVSMPAGPIPAPLTVVLDFRGPSSPRAVIEMQRESERIVRDSGLRLDWRSRSEGVRSSFDDLVVVQFQGSCLLEPDPNLYSELPPLGPLAFTYSTDGVVQPFSRVECDKVAAFVRSAMWGADFAKADLLMGRALGRVVTHELVHVLTRSGEHGRNGVARRSLSPKQLISESLPLSADDLARLRKVYQSR